CFFAGAYSIFYGDKLLTAKNPGADADRSLFLNSISCRRSRIAVRQRRQRCRFGHSPLQRDSFFAQRAAKLFEIDRFDQVQREANLLRPPKVFLHPITRKRDATEVRLKQAKFSKELQTGS